jgi:hypothetical protein
VTTVWERDPRALWRRSGTSVVLAAPDADEIVVLDGTGAVTWRLVADPMGEDELVGVLSDCFGVDAETVRRQVVPFLEKLRAAGAVRAR